MLNEQWKIFFVAALTGVSAKDYSPEFLVERAKLIADAAYVKIQELEKKQEASLDYRKGSK